MSIQDIRKRYNEIQARRAHQCSVTTITRGANFAEVCPRYCVIHIIDEDTGERVGTMSKGCKPLDDQCAWADDIGELLDALDGSALHGKAITWPS